MRLIDADALVQMLENDAKHMEDPVGRAWTYAAINDIKNAPTADVVEVKRGKWIKLVAHHRFYNEERTVCSECGGEPFEWDDSGEWLSDFCPHCGAYLREEE